MVRNKYIPGPVQERGCGLQIQPLQPVTEAAANSLSVALSSAAALSRHPSGEPLPPTQAVILHSDLPYPAIVHVAI